MFNTYIIYDIYTSGYNLMFLQVISLLSVTCVISAMVARSSIVSVSCLIGLFFSITFYLVELGLDLTLGYFYVWFINYIYYIGFTMSILSAGVLILAVLPAISRTITDIYNSWDIKMRRYLRGNVDLTYCRLEPSTLIMLEGKLTRVQRPSVFVYAKSTINYGPFMKDLPNYTPIPNMTFPNFVNRGHNHLSIGIPAVVNINGVNYLGFFYCNRATYAGLGYNFIHVSIDANWINMVTNNNMLITSSGKPIYVRRYDFPYSTFTIVALNPDWHSAQNISQIKSRL